MFKFGNIILRPLEKEDLKLIHEWENDYNLFLYTRATPLHFITMQEVENEYQEDLKRKTTQRFIIELTDTHTLLGSARITIHQRGDVRAADIGLYLAHEQNWNKKIGRTVTLALLEMLFYHRSFEKVNAISAEFNIRAHKVLEFCGFKKEGVWRRGIKLYGQYYAWYLFGILYEEYMNIRETLLKTVLADNYKYYVTAVTPPEKRDEL